MNVFGNIGTKIGTNNIVKQCLSSLVSLFLILGMVPQSAFGEVPAQDLVISSVDELIAFRDEVNGGNNFSGKIVKLAADLDVSSESPWVPIGNSSSKPFKGTFDGDGHKITGLHLNASQNYQGLFGYVYGTVEKLTLEGVTCDEGSGNYVGGICGYSGSGSTISNCTVTGDINGGYDVGGICGYGSNISNCTFSGTVNGSRDVGGICGYNYSSVTDCIVSGTVNGSSNNVGGICGYLFYSSVTDCIVSGTITGGNNTVGGICGYASGSSVIITACAVLADVSGKVTVGGICGTTADVTDCYAVGNITGESEVGGIIGGAPSTCSNYKNNVKSCFFAGTLTGTGTSSVCYVGGIGGYDVSDSFENCVCLASKIEGTGDPDIDIIGYISAAYSAEKPGSSLQGASVETGNDSDCYYHADLNSSTGTSYDGESFDLESGWQQKMFGQTLSWDTTVWDIPDVSSPAYSIAALPTLKALPSTIKQMPYLDKKVPKLSDFIAALPDKLDYDGKPKAITITPKSGITGMGAVTVKYYKVENGSTTLLDGPPTDAGRYKVKFDVAAGTEYFSLNDLPAVL
mgnify:CR=1 FL=1